MDNRRLLVDRTISPHDMMFRQGDPDHYFEVGRSALENIFRATAASGKAPKRILDFGCGAGRVTRWIDAAFPASHLEACDIRAVDVDFVRRFCTNAWISKADPDRLAAPSTYDLIWVGSVFTHLPESASVRLFDKLCSWLTPEGVLVFSIHGQFVAGNGSNANFYGIPAEWQRVLRDFEKGYGYADYDNTPGYGISITRLEWWSALASARGVRIVDMTERGWDGHHDVIAVQSLATRQLGTWTIVGKVLGASRRL